MNSKKELSLTLLIFLSTIGAVAVMSPVSTSDNRPSHVEASAVTGTAVTPAAHASVAAVRPASVRPSMLPEPDADIHSFHFASNRQLSLKPVLR